MDVAPNLCFLLCVLLYITPYQTDALLFNNCVVSPWSTWRKVKSRTRTVVRQPTRGGTDCPSLVEIIDLKTSKTADKIARKTSKTADKIARKTCKTADKIARQTSKTANKIARFFLWKHVSSEKRIGSDPVSTGSGTSSTGSGTGSTGPGHVSTDFDRDILLVVDSSASISRGHFDAAKSQIAKLLGMVCPHPDPFRKKHRVALIQYSSEVRKLFDFNDNANTLQVLQEINNMAYQGGNTCTAEALTQALQMFHVSKGMRTGNNVTHELLLLSDGQPRCGRNDDKKRAVEAASKLKKYGIEMYALIIGDHTKSDRKELKKCVSEPMDQHLFALTGYEELEKLVKYVQAGIDVGNTCASIG